MKHPIAAFEKYLERPVFIAGRIALVLLCIPLALSFFLPLWRISMEAPQYPRGLTMDIYAHRLVGGHDGEDLQEINTLNHYIGMRHISDEEIPDLGWMPFAIGGLLLLTLRAAAIGNVRTLVDHSMVVVYTFGFLGARFIYRMYQYGHDLDPRAPMTIDPFMPVIIGTKQIANFTTHGWPQTGGVCVLVFGLGVAGITVWHLVAGRLSAARVEKTRAATEALTDSPLPPSVPERPAVTAE